MLKKLIKQPMMTLKGVISMLAHLCRHRPKSTGTEEVVVTRLDSRNRFRMP